MKFLILTCNATRHIVEAQKWLFDKYVGLDKFEFIYIDLKDEPVATWTKNIYEKIKHIDDELVLFGLDDYLPIDHFNFDYFKNIVKLMHTHDIDRYELGWGASRKDKWIQNGFEEVYAAIEWDGVTDSVKQNYLRYRPQTPYSVSCQFSLWRTTSLLNLLKHHTCDPWSFETKLKLSHVACNREPVFRWIEESALSGRHPGKINILGLRPADAEQLIALRHIDRIKTQYGMPNGPLPPFNPKKAGAKYQEFYE